MDGSKALAIGFSVQKHIKYEWIRAQTLSGLTSVVIEAHFYPRGCNFVRKDLFEYIEKSLVQPNCYLHPVYNTNCVIERGTLNFFGLVFRGAPVDVTYCANGDGNCQTTIAKGNLMSDLSPSSPSYW